MSKSMTVPDEFIFPCCSKCGGFVSGLFTTSKLIVYDYVLIMYSNVLTC